MGDRLSIEAARAEFDLGDLAYLDTPSQGVPTRAGAEALARALDAWRSGRADYEDWEADADVARIAVAALLGVPPGDVALVPTVAIAAALLAVSEPGGCVVVPEAEYRSNLYPWLTRQDVRLVEGTPLTDAILEAIDERVSLVAVSSVQAVDGRAVDLARIVEAAHAHGARVFVDATQGLGAVGRDLAASGADAIAAAGYKFLLGGRGSGYLYLRPELQALQPVAAGPRASADGGAYGPPYRLRDDAGRFDQSLAWHAWPPARAGAELLAAVGADALERHATGLVARVREGLAERGLAGRLAPEEGPTPIVSVRCDDPEGVVAALAADGVRAAARGGAIRAGFHLFNDDEHADRLVAGLAAAIG
ncbi:MAG TPA: aminotransferase class V-fold PLP-dependent enzyme [Capillimicrobium sp.]|nr:aminotransferase class V-fold PLP-dependent enzyme [Capillimicrobium sp.]